MVFYSTSSQFPCSCNTTRKSIVLKAPEEEGELQEVTVSLDAAKEIKLSYQFYKNWINILKGTNNGQISDLFLLCFMFYFKFSFSFE